MLKKFVMAAAVSLGALGFGMAGQALADADVNIGIGLGGGYYGDGGGYYRPGPAYPAYYDGGRISCRQGARIVASAGFRRVRPIDCEGTEYTYRGMRRGDMYKITVKSRNGHIKKASRIRGGGYDDDYYDY